MNPDQQIKSILNGILFGPEQSKHIMSIRDSLNEVIMTAAEHVTEPETEEDWDKTIDLAQSVRF